MNTLQPEKSTSTRATGVGALAAIVSMVMPWMQFGGIVGMVVPVVSGFELIVGRPYFGGSEPIAYRTTILTPSAGLLCLLLLAFSRINPRSFDQNRRLLAILRILVAVAGIIPPLYIYYMVSQAGAAYVISSVSCGFGVYLAIIGLLIIAGEAVMELLGVRQSVSIDNKNVRQEHLDADGGEETGQGLP